MPPEPARFPLPLMFFTAGYFLAASASALVFGNREFVFYIVVMAVLITAIAVVHRRSVLGRPLLWCLSVWGLLHMAGGLVPIPRDWNFNGPHSVLYSWWLVPGWLRYDQLVHAYGFAVTTWLCWEALRNGLWFRHGIELRPRWGVVVLCAAGGMGFGAFNEVVEFVATLLLEETNVGGYVNTGWDLVFNLLGASLAAVLIRLRGGSPPAAAVADRRG